MSFAASCERSREDGYLPARLFQSAYDDGLIRFVLAGWRLMSAFGGKADIDARAHLRPLLAVKRTYSGRKRTFGALVRQNFKLRHDRRRPALDPTPACS